MPRVPRILAIHAHPDDIEILAGGTLALLAALGHTITMVSMTPGDCGTSQYPADEISCIRRKEAAASASKIGAEYFCGEFRDMAIFNNDASRRRVTAILRRTRPDIVLTSAPVDYLCDHEMTSALVRDACFAAPCMNYVCGHAQPLDRIPHLYFMDPIQGTDREQRPIPPDFVVDVTAVFQLKREMLACHDSQRAWLKKHHDMDDYLDSMERWTTERGRTIGVKYGEGFRQYRGHPYPEAPLLQQLLGI